MAAFIKHSPVESHRNIVNFLTYNIEREAQNQSLARTLWKQIAKES